MPETSSHKITNQPSIGRSMTRTGRENGQAIPSETTLDKLIIRTRTIFDRNTSEKSRTKC